MMLQTKSFLSKSTLTTALILMLFLNNCTPKKEYPKLEYRDFTGQLAAFAEKNEFNTADYHQLNKQHGRVFQIWLNEILDFGSYPNANDSIKTELLREFIFRNKPAFKAVQQHYAKYPNFQQDISNAFGKLNEILGNVKKPVIFNYFSQFSNYNTFIDTTAGHTVLAFSSEMFMDDTFTLYKLLEVPDFFNRYNHTKQLSAMLLWTYLKGRFEVDNPEQKMIDEAVFNGKIWYTIEQVLGEDEIYAALGYTEKEWKMLIADEGQIWRNYLNNDLLFSSDFNEYKRFFIYGKYTYGGGVPEEYPPLLGNFTGYRIVSAYMKKTGADLKTMWNFKDGSKLLKQSAYNPLK
jgi:hypothetical protein